MNLIPASGTGIFFTAPARSLLFLVKRPPMDSPSPSRSPSMELDLSQVLPRRSMSRERLEPGNSPENRPKKVPEKAPKKEPAKLPEIDLAKMLGELEDEDGEKSEAKKLSAILRQNTQQRPKFMVSADEVDESEKKSIQNSLQTRGIKRSIFQVKKAQKVADALKEMRSSQGSGSRFPWNDLQWQRTLKCVEDGFTVPKITDMHAFEQISLSEQVDFANLKMHNMPRNHTNSELERKAIKKANTEFKNGIFAHKSHFNAWETWCITQLTARIAVLNGMHRIIFCFLTEVAKKQPATPLQSLQKWLDAWHRCTTLTTEESNALAAIVSKSVPPTHMVTIIHERWCYLALNSPEIYESDLGINAQQRVWKETSGKPEIVVKSFPDPSKHKKTATKEDSTNPYSISALKRLDFKTRSLLYKNLVKLHGRKTRPKTRRAGNQKPTRKGKGRKRKREETKEPKTKSG